MNSVFFVRSLKVSPGLAQNSMKYICCDNEYWKGREVVQQGSVKLPLIVTPLKLGEYGRLTRMSFRPYSSNLRFLVLL